MLSGIELSDVGVGFEDVCDEVARLRMSQVCPWIACDVQERNQLAFSKLEGIRSDFGLIPVGIVIVVEGPCPGSVVGIIKVQGKDNSYVIPPNTIAALLVENLEHELMIPARIMRPTGGEVSSRGRCHITVTARYASEC